MLNIYLHHGYLVLSQFWLKLLKTFSAVVPIHTGINGHDYIYDISSVNQF